LLLFLKRRAFSPNCDNLVYRLGTVPDVLHVDRRMALGTIYFVRFSFVAHGRHPRPIASGVRTGPDEILLAKYRARATFFLIGAKAAKHPELTRRILDAGHTIGNHTQTHPRFSFWHLGPSALVREIDEFEATISSIGVAAPIWFRAPAGLKNPFLHPILAARGLQLVGWSVRAFDTQIDDSSKIVERIKRSIVSGAIILFHEGHQPTVCLKALEQLLQELTAEQFSLVLPQPRELLAGRRSASWETS
jgi:hypothetical protein